MNVWKIASRWSKTGTKKSSILDLFRKYNIVFAGKKTEQIRDSVKIGDTVAISDGLKIIAVAKVISTPSSITNFSEIQDDDKKRFEFEDWVIAFRVEIYNLNQDEIFTTKKGTFHGMGKYTEKVIELYNQKVLDNTKFEINAYPYNIINSDPSKPSLLNQNQQYVIPVYQRPYSWNEEQIESFLNDIFISYWGTDQQSSAESMFIGTMQLSDKKYSDTAQSYQEVIDGQQRITTITLLLKLLQIKYPNNDKLKSLTFTWLDSHVNRGQQSKDLKAVIIDDNYDDELNKFAVNYKLIKTYFEANIQVEDTSVIFEEEKFILHLLENVYFVVIETRAGLSKTLQIFKAINTAGLDLNSTDVFKNRLYEYLSKNSNNDDVFESIDKLYEKIDIQNSIMGREVTNMSGILEIYKYYLISKYKLNMTLWKMATGTFFERLFDTLLEIKQWSDFGSLKKINDLLSVQTIDLLIDIRYRWQNKHYSKQGNFDDFNTMLSLRLLWWSRYSKYWVIPFLYLMRNDANDSKYNILIQEFSRLYITFSLLFQKQVNSIHSFTKDIASEITNGTNIDDIIDKIKQKYISHKTEIQKIINGDIFWNPKIKNILMRMSAAIDENYQGVSIKEIENKVFKAKKIDIEHIKSRNDASFNTNPQTKDLWKDLLNTVGNLVILEYNINRSIGNDPFNEKVKQYNGSCFTSVNQLAQKTTWDISDAQTRKQNEIQKIENFIY
jgi:hypothetical protein